LRHSLNSSLLQINTRVWLQERAAALGRPATLDDVPAAALDRIADQGFAWVWWLGVWQTGPAGREVARAQPALQSEYRAVLPDLQEADIGGSPFAVQQYVVHEDFGGPAALRRLRDRMRRGGLKLLLDFVPNHTALDHPWVWAHPEFYVPGSEADVIREPGNYRRLPTGSGERIIAHGRDPHIVGWTDTLQLNYRHRGLRQAMIDQLLDVARQCDGVRCDMAMLILPDVFRQTWGDRSLPADGSPPADEPFWPEAIAAVREAPPDFLFMAEVYWDLEAELQRQGFDCTYGKRLYDWLQAGDAARARACLTADLEFQQRLVRFLENHDEARAASAFLPVAKHFAAALATFLAPGLRFFHDGQLDGRRIRVPMQLGRRPPEPPDPAVQDFYARLLPVLQRPEVQQGQWRLLACEPVWEGHGGGEGVIAYLWQEPGVEQALLVAVNYSSSQGQCYVRLPRSDWMNRPVVLRDLLGPAVYERHGRELMEPGLYLELPAWGYHLFAVSRGG